MRPQGDRTHRNDRLDLGRTQMKTEVLIPLEGYNDYDNMFSDSRNHVIKAVTLV